MMVRHRFTPTCPTNSLQGPGEARRQRLRRFEGRPGRRHPLPAHRASCRRAQHRSRYESCGQAVQIPATASDHRYVKARKNAIDSRRASGSTSIQDGTQPEYALSARAPMLARNQPTAGAIDTATRRAASRASRREPAPAPWETSGQPLRAPAAHFPTGPTASTEAACVRSGRTPYARFAQARGATSELSLAHRRVRNGVARVLSGSHLGAQ